MQAQPKPSSSTSKSNLHYNYCRILLIAGYYGSKGSGVYKQNLYEANSYRIVGVRLCVHLT